MDRLFDVKNGGFRVFNESGKLGDKEHNVMSCEERLSHAIQIDKIKIFPNSSAIIEKTKRRSI